jgi:hypothetical protein
MKRAQSPWITMYKYVQAKYLDGAKSIPQNLPMLVPPLKTLFPVTNKAITFGHIPENQIFNHFLPLGYDCYFHCAGFNEDWTECHNGFFSLLNYDDNCCEFFQDLHRDVKEMMMDSPYITKDKRVVVLQVWSDMDLRLTMSKAIHNLIVFKFLL